MSWRVHVSAVGFVAPGLADMAALEAFLGGAEYRAEPDWKARPQRLPTRQARRLSGGIALAISAAEQIAGAVPAEGGWVFASALGEGGTLNNILNALCQPEIMVQPLRFQNAVHNAAQGQWSIACGGVGPGTSIAAFDDTAGAGFLKAAMQAHLERLPVGLVIYDEPLPVPLNEKRPMSMPIAAALALSPDPGPFGAVEIGLRAGPAARARLPEPLGSCGNPACHAIPLLAALHAGRSEEFTLSLPGAQSLQISTSPHNAD